MLTESAITTKPNKILFINPKGPIYKQSSKEDDIYIDCQSVTATIDQDNDVSFSDENSRFASINTHHPTTGSVSSKMSSTNYTIILVVVGVLIAIILIFVLRRFM